MYRKITWFVLGVWLVSFVSVRAEAQDFKIVQVQITGGSGKTTEDFVEIRNMSAREANLKGTKLVKRTAAGKTDTILFSFDSDLTLAPNASVIWANNSLKAAAWTPDVTSDGSIADDNGIALRADDKDAGTIVDSLAWGKAENGYTKVVNINPTANQSIQIQNDTTYLIAVSNPRFLNAPSTPVNTSIKSQTSTVITQLEHLEISEILVDPEGEDKGKERIEIHNPTDASVYMEGMYLLDTGKRDLAYLFPSIYINPQSYIVVGLPADGFALDNKGDTVRLYNKSNKLLSEVEYGEVKSGLTYQKLGSGYLWLEQTFGYQNYISSRDDISKSIIISEIFISADKDGVGSYFELYNTGTRSVDTSRLEIRLKHGSSEYYYDIATVGYIHPNGYSIYELGEDDSALPSQNFDLELTYSRDRLARISLKEIEQGKSYSYIDSNYSWHEPSPGEKAGIIPLHIELSEIVSNPGLGNEYIEIYNPSDHSVDLSKYYLSNNDTKITMSGSLESHAFVLIETSNRLHNTGAVLRLKDPRGKLLEEITYPSLSTGSSYAKYEAVWKVSSEITPSGPNIIAEPETPTKTSTTSKSIDSKVYGITTINKLLKENGLIKKDLLDSQKAIKTLTNDLLKKVNSLGATSESKIKPWQLLTFSSFAAVGAVFASRRKKVKSEEIENQL